MAAKFYNEDGTPNTKIDSFFKNAAHPEGLPAFSRFMQEHIRYPDQARKLGFEGRVYVEFIVSKEGKVTNPKVIRSVAGSLDEEALRVIRLLPAWEPGIFGGMPAEARMVLPVTFKLEN